jgi:hypothetical protein
MTYQTVSPICHLRRRPLQFYLRFSSTVTFTVPLGESIVSEGNGEYMFVEGRMLTSRSEPRSGRGYRDVGDGRQG